MRFLTALVMAFVVCIGLPTIAAADLEPASGEQTADSPDATREISMPTKDVVLDESMFDADLTPTMETIPGVLQVPRVPLPVGIAPHIGPNGFSPEIWRPVNRAESAPPRNYESGLALNRC